MTSPIKTTYNALMVLITSVSRVLNGLGKILYYFEKISSFADYFRGVFTRFSLFFSGISAAWNQLCLVWTNLQKMIGAFRYLIQPIIALLTTLYGLLAKTGFSIGYFNGQFHHTKRIYGTIHTSLQDYLELGFAQIQSVSDTFSNITNYLPASLLVGIHVVMVSMTTLISMVVCVTLAPFIFLYYTIYKEQPTNGSYGNQGNQDEDTIQSKKIT